MSHNFVTIVSGLPRSGTSLMLQILAAGGMPVLTDGQRTADPTSRRQEDDTAPTATLRPPYRTASPRTPPNNAPARPHPW